MSSINSDEIISILREEIENFDTMSRDSEVGTVVCGGRRDRLDLRDRPRHVRGDPCTFETGLKGMVQDIRKDEIGCILFGSDSGIREGTKVSRTGKRWPACRRATAFIGRVVNALGEAIDGRGEIEADDYRPDGAERRRGSWTGSRSAFRWRQGILSIDAMFPIGGGQRELIIGDRRPARHPSRWIPS